MNSAANTLSPCRSDSFCYESLGSSRAASPLRQSPADIQRSKTPESADDESTVNAEIEAEVRVSPYLSVLSNDTSTDYSVEET